MNASELNEKLAQQTRRYEAMAEFRSSRAYHHTEIKHDPDGWQGQQARIEFHEQNGMSYTVMRLTPVEALELRDQLTAYLADNNFDEAALVQQAGHLLNLRADYDL